MPFSGESAVSIALKHLQSETPSVRDFDASIPQSVENIVLKATAKDSNHRYISAESMELDLETCLSAQRINEPKFMPPVDNDATKIIPIIKEPKTTQNGQQPVPGTTVKLERKPVEQPAPNQTPKQKKKKWPLIVGIVVLVAIIGIVAAAMLTPNKVPVPDVANKPIDEAIKILEDAGFIIGGQDERNSEDVEQGNVIETSPREGLEKVKGTEIDLIVSIGKETDIMDDFVNKQYEQVISILDGQGFKSVTTNEVYSEEPSGVIIEQSPEAGDEIVIGETEVVLTISKGLEKVSVISLKGFNEANRKEYERSSGLKTKVTGEKYSDTVAAGSVIEQNPVAGTELVKGGTINVVISKGPEAKKEKLYTRSVKIPYEPVEEGIEQIVTIYIQDKTHTLVDPLQTFPITEDTSYLLQFTIVEGETAAYQIVRDDIVIDKQSIPYDSLP